MGEIRIVGSGQTREYPYLVCKNALYYRILEITVTSITQYRHRKVNRLLPSLLATLISSSER